MFSCELCDKQYAYPHKLHHHALWLCKGRTSESCMLTSPRRSGSRNCFLLPPTPEKGEGEAELVEELKETNRNDDVEVTNRKVDNEEEVFPCDACGKSFPSKNSRRKHKKKKHPQQLQEFDSFLQGAQGEGVQQVASERVSEPQPSLAKGEDVQQAASERVSKPQPSLADGEDVQQVASERVSEPQPSLAEGKGVQQVALERVSSLKKRSLEKDEHEVVTKAARPESCASCRYVFKNARSR